LVEIGHPAVRRPSIRRFAVWLLNQLWHQMKAWKWD
jgi:hypothetical protein